jgi:hypothetical protein
VGACALLVSLSVVRLGVDREMLVHVHSLHRHRPITDAEVPVVEHLRIGTHWAVWLSRALLGAAIVAWMVTARRIVQTYDCDLYRSDVSMAVAGWFVPPLFLGAPYVLMADVWTASHPSRGPAAVVDRLKVPQRVFWWWALFLLSLGVGVIETLDAAVGVGPWAPFDVHLDYVMTGSQVVSACLLAWIVIRTTGFIENRAATATL